MNAADLAELVGRYRYQCVSEAHLQDALQQLFEREGVEFLREEWIAGGCRIDFVVGRVGVEVKTAGSAGEVARQLRRYLASPRIDEVLLVTTKTLHRALDGLDGVTVAQIGSPW